MTGAMTIKMATKQAMIDSTMGHCNDVTKYANIIQIIEVYITKM